MRLSKHNNDIFNQQDKMPVINRYLVYCRKSSESDERQIQSLPDQIHTLVTLYHLSWARNHWSAIARVKISKDSGVDPCLINLFKK